MSDAVARLKAWGGGKPRAEEYLSSEQNLFDVVVSPDGTVAAYASNESGQYEVRSASSCADVVPRQISSS